MRRSDNHILTSHVGSLPRPDALIESNRARDAGELTDPAAFEATLRTAVTDVVRQQRDLGIDVPGDGEFGKSMAQRVNYGSWWRYSWQRLAGIEPGEQTLYEMTPQRSRPGHIVLTSFGIVATAQCLRPPTTIRNPGSRPARARRRRFASGRWPMPGMT